MFGAWQAGVWCALESHVRPDIVVGASAGTLNGWLIASGCSGEELIRRWSTLDHLADVRWRIPRKVSEGLLDGSKLEALIQDMCSTAQPTLEFGVVLTELARMRPVLYRHPNLTWQHVAASCAVPFFLPHHQIDGLWHSDGGLLDPLPVWAAIEMGATRIIGINCLKAQPTWLAECLGALRRMTNYRRPDLSGVQFVEIGPGSSLGGARDCMYWTRANAERWTALGQADGKGALRSVVECFRRGRPDGAPAESDQGCTHTVFTV